MSWFKRLLVKSRLVVMEARPPEAAAAARTQPLVTRRTVTLADLVQERRDEIARRQQARLEAGAGLTVDPDAVFAASGLAKPPHGWSVDDVCKFLDAPERSQAEPASRQRDLLTRLALDKVPPEEILEDARLRDHALDTYEAFVKVRVAETRRHLDEEEAAIEAKIAALKAEKADVQTRRASLRDTLRRWREAKRDREQRWTEALRYLTEQQVVSVDAIPED